MLDWWVLAYLGLRPRDEEQVIRGHDKLLCEELGLSGSGQMRSPYVHKNLHWSFDDGATSFGYGDLDESDLNDIWVWIIIHSELWHSSLIFTGWNEHHDTDWQQTDLPMIKITNMDGITFPYREARVNR